MRGIWPSLRRLVVDTVMPLPVGYYLVLHDDCLQMLRVWPFSSKLLYEASYSGDGLTAIDEILTWHALHMRSTQPVAVLVNGQCFVSVRRAEKLSAVQALKTIKSLQTDTAEVNFASIRTKEASWLIVQGVNHQLRQMLNENLEKAAVSVLFLQPLVGYLISASRILSQQPSLTVYQWSAQKTTYLGVNERGEVFDGQLRFGETMDVAALEALKRTYLPESAAVQLLSVSTSPTSRGKKYAKALSSRPVFDRKNRPLQATISTSIQARVSLVAINSLKLLNLIVAIVLILCLIIAAGFSLARSANSAEVSAFQQIYSQRLDLERQLKSLERAHVVTEQTGSSSEAAALLAAFCQTSATDVKLASISLRQAKDTLLCEVAGRADDDMAVFGYLDDLKPLVDPWVVKLSSLRPEIITLEGQQDTVLAFKLMISKEPFGAQK